MLDRLEKVREEGFLRIAEAADRDALEAVRKELTGKKSALQEVLKSLGGLEPEMRKSVGMKANEVKNMFAEKIQARADELIASASAAERTRCSRPSGRPTRSGTPPTCSSWMRG